MCAPGRYVFNDIGVEVADRWIYADHVSMLRFNVVHHVCFAAEVWHPPLALQ